MDPKVKEQLKKRYIQCATDPAFFIRNYVYIQNPVLGRVKFNLFDFQYGVLLQFLKNPSETFMILKSRQLGLSTLVAAYALWLMLFHSDKNVVALATTQATAKNLITKIKFAYDNLPKWLQVPTVEKNKLSIKFTNGSGAKAMSSNPESARSEAVSLLLVDEAAFIDNIEPTYTAAQQTLATGGRSIILSTPNGVGNWFHRKWQEAEQKRTSWIPIKLKWDVHPERDQTWRDQQDEELGEKMAAQECDCSFLTSGFGVYENRDLKWYLENTVEEPIEKRGRNKTYWLWDVPNYEKTYLVTADVARGDGSDYSTFHVFDIETFDQVAEFEDKVTTKEFAHILKTAGHEWNDAIILVEANNMGWGVLEDLIEMGYPNVYHSPGNVDITPDEYIKQFEEGNLKPGLYISSRTRPLVVDKGKLFIRSKDIKIRSRRLINQCFVFVYKGGKERAQDGYNDDLVMAFNNGAYVRDVALKYRSQGMNLARASMDAFGILNSRNYQIQTAFRDDGRKTYKIDNGKGQYEDIKWLLG